MSIILRSKVWKISRANISTQRTQLRNDETEISKLAKEMKKAKNGNIQHKNQCTSKKLWFSLVNFGSQLG